MPWTPTAFDYTDSAQISIIESIIESNRFAFECAMPINEITKNDVYWP